MPLSHLSYAKPSPSGTSLVVRSQAAAQLCFKKQEPFSSQAATKLTKAIKDQLHIRMNKEAFRGSQPLSVFSISHNSACSHNCEPLLQTGGGDHNEARTPREGWTLPLCNDVFLP